MKTLPAFYSNGSIPTALPQCYCSNHRCRILYLSYEWCCLLVYRSVTAGSHRIACTQQGWIRGNLLLHWFLRHVTTDEAHEGQWGRGVKLWVGEKKGEWLNNFRARSSAGAWSKTPWRQWKYSYWLSWALAWVPGIVQQSSIDSSATALIYTSWGSALQCLELSFFLNSLEVVPQNKDGKLWRSHFP